MPELPEVETICRSLRRRLVGARLEAVRVRDGRLRQPVRAASLRRALVGKRVLGLRRRAKYLLVDFESNRVLMVHLGMSGHLDLVANARPLLKHDHVIFELSSGRDLRFNDARRFGFVDAFSSEREAEHPRLVHLGYEPFDRALSGEVLFLATRGRHRPIKTFLMDATEIVGVGNIYASEALFRARVHPTRPVGRVTREQWLRIVDGVRSTLRDAIRGGGTTLRDYVDPDGRRGAFSDRLAVYGRGGEPCLRCSRPIRRVVQTGRSTFYCPTCQPSRGR